MARGRRDLTFDKGLPTSTESEKLILGAILLDYKNFSDVARLISITDFALEKHKKIFSAMQQLNEAGTPIDRVTLANHLMRRGDLESVDGFTYLVSLDNDLPQVYNVASYAEIVREKSILRRTIVSSQMVIDRCLVDKEDAKAITRDALSTFLQLSSDAAPSMGEGPQTFNELIETYPGGLTAMLDPTKMQRGLMTGYEKLDEWTSGMHPGDLFCIAGATSSGKSSLAGNITEYVGLKLEKRAAYFSLEMQKDMVFRRMMCSQARVDQLKFRNGFLNADERFRIMQAANRIAASRIIVDGSANLSIIDLASKVKHLTATEPLDLVVVDHIQLMLAVSGDGRPQEVAGITRGLKMLAMDLGIPVIMLSQLRKAAPGQGKIPPGIDDLKESSSIAQDSDAVMFVHRPEMFQRDRMDLQGVAHVYLRKQRNGPTGRIPLVWLKEFTRFENPADPFQQDLDDGA